MKNRQTETKFKSVLAFAGYLFSRVVCLGAIILICSSAPAQNLFVGDGSSNNIYEFTPTGVRSTFASGISGALAFDKSGNLFAAAGGSGAIYKFTPNGVPTTFASGFDGNGTLLASNDNWKDTQQAQIQATGLAPTNDAESATVQTLAPGNYTVILRGKNNTIGVALVEVYGLN